MFRSKKSISILLNCCLTSTTTTTTNHEFIQLNINGKQLQRFYSKMTRYSNNNNNNRKILNCKQIYSFAILKRLFNTTHTETVNEKNNFLRSHNVQTIDTITIADINKFDRLRIKSPFNLNIHPLSPREYPLMNKVFLTLYGDSNLGFTKPEWSKMFDIHIQYDTEQGTLNIINSLTQIGEEKLIEECAQTLECHLEVPFQAGISVECTTNNNVSIHNLDTKEIFVNSKKGECVLDNLKANSIIVHSDSGNIECLKTLHGNIDLSTNKCGSIISEKLLGSFIKLRAENNDIITNSIYSENFSIKAKKSNISVKNAKGNGIIDLENGKIEINSMDGQLNAQSNNGDIKVFFSSINDNSTIKANNGDVYLSFIENLNANIQLISKRFLTSEFISSKFKTKKLENGLLSYSGNLISNNDSNSNLSVTSPKGKVKVDIIDWFSTLKLK